jgi:hypothetical protein
MRPEVLSLRKNQVKLPFFILFNIFLRQNRETRRDNRRWGMALQTTAVAR